MDLGMPTLIEHNTLQEAAELCQKLQLNFIELNMNLPDYQIDQLEDISKLQEIADTYGIYFTIHLDEKFNAFDFNPLVSNAYFETIKRTIAVAKRLNTPLINLHMNEGVYMTLPDKKIFLYSKYESHYMSKIKTLRDICEEYIGDSHIKISIENTDGYKDFEISAIEYLLQSDVFSLTWDIGHSHAAGNTDVPFIIKNVDKLAHFHIHDAIGKSNHLVLGSGEIDLKQRLEVAQKYNCRCVIETKTVVALMHSVEWLKAK